jgi:hypothetical protein
MGKEEWLDALNDDVQDIRALTIAVREETKEIREEVKLLREEVKESKRKADAAGELVILTHEHIKEELAYLKKPIWKKWFGTK